MAREIGTRLTVDGEQAYKRAIQEASKSISQMGTQLTLATAQFKADGDAMKLMSSRSKTLRAEIDQQKAIVKSLEGAVKDMTAQYGENSKEAEKWQAELNRAQAKLINLQNELDNNDKGLDKNGRAFDKDAQQAQAFGKELTALDKIQQSTTFQALNTALQNVENGFKTALSKGKEFGEFVWNKAVESSNRYDELATDATKLGVSVQELRAWQLAAELVDTGIGDITKGMTKLVNPTDKVSDALRTLGVRAKEAFVDMESPGDLIVQQKSTLDLFWESIEALNALEDATKQEELANTLFGKSFRDLLPLIKAGRETWDAYVQKAMETAPDEGAAEKLTTFNDALVEYNQVMQDFQDTFMAGIAPGLTDMTNAGTQFLTELTKWAQSETGQEKLNELSGAISNLVSSLATEENFNAVISAATGVINEFTEALNWIIENWKGVAIGIGAIAIIANGIKVGSGVLSFLTMIKEIQWLNVAKGASALGGAAGAGGSAAASGGSAAAGGATAAAGGSFLGKIFTGAKNALTGAVKVAPFAAPFALMFDSFRQSWETQMKAHKWLEEAQTYAEERTQEVEALQGDEAFETLKSVWKRLSDAISTGDATKSGSFLFDFADMYDRWAYEDFPELDAVFDNISEETADKFTAMMEQALNGENIDPYSVINLLNEIMEQLDAEISKQTEENKANGKEIGEAVSEGMAAGIDAKASAAIEAAGRLAAGVNAQLRSVLKIASPSKVTRGLGQFVGEGFALGIDDAQDKVTAAINRMASIGTPRRAAAAFAGGAYDGRTYHSSRSLYIDKYNQYSGADVHELMDALDAETRYTNQGMGA